MADFNFKEIDAARKLLGLPSEATLTEIKEAYRNKVREYHPDKCQDEKKKGENEKKMAQINRAYKILLNYIEEYKFSFKEEAVERYRPDRDMRRFYQDWLGGGYGKR